MATYRCRTAAGAAEASCNTSMRSARRSSMETSHVVLTAFTPCCRLTLGMTHGRHRTGNTKTPNSREYVVVGPLIVVRRQRLEPRTCRLMVEVCAFPAHHGRPRQVGLTSGKVVAMSTPDHGNPQAFRCVGLV